MAHTMLGRISELPPNLEVLEIYFFTMMGLFTQRWILEEVSYVPGKS